nr:MAG TPA: hypothetical protein [Caudoviricetes sp.]
MSITSGGASPFVSWHRCVRCFDEYIISQLVEIVNRKNEIFSFLIY